MKRLSFDQTTAWLLALVIAITFFSGGYFLLIKIAKEPSRRMQEALENHQPTASTQASHPDEHHQQDESASTSSQHDAHTPKASGEHDGPAGIEHNAPFTPSENVEEHKASPGASKGEDHSSTPPLKHLQETEWGYQGQSGPDFWGDLSEEYLDCQVGRAQSPIDLNSPIPSHELRPLQLDYHPASVQLENDGHVVFGRYEPGSFLSYNGQRYQLLRFQFHLPSEHTVDGIPYDMEMQLIHQDEAGKLAIIGVFMEESDAQHLALQKMWQDLPASKGGHGQSVTLNLEDLLPKDRSYYAYTGSQTQPPCREGVDWLLFTQAIKISSSQIDQFIKIYRNNARPIQASNKRQVSMSRVR